MSLVVFFHCRNLVLAVQPPAKVDELAPLAAERERTGRIDRRGIIRHFNRLAADGARNFHHTDAGA